MSGAIRFLLAVDLARRIADRRPLCSLLLLALLQASRLAGASPNAPDTVQVESLPSPRGALLRSALLPGWGQLYNRRPAKAAFFGVSAFGLLGWAFTAHRELAKQAEELDELRRRDPADLRLPALIAARQDQAARRNTRLLYWALATTFTALDAYVDAHLADFVVTQTSFALHPQPGGGAIQFYALW